MFYKLIGILLTVKSFIYKIIRKNILLLNFEVIFIEVLNVWIINKIDTS